MPKYYLLDENKNLIEGYTKEQFLGILEQAIEDGDLSGIDEDSAVASKLRSTINGTTHHIEFVTQAQYNQLLADEDLVPNTYYFITDDDTAEDLENAINDLQVGTNSLESIIEQIEDGSIVVGKAEEVETTDFSNEEFQYIYLPDTDHIFFPTSYLLDYKEPIYFYASKGTTLINFGLTYVKNSFTAGDMTNSPIGYDNGKMYALTFEYVSGILGWRVRLLEFSNGTWTNVTTSGGFTLYYKLIK